MLDFLHYSFVYVSLYHIYKKNVFFAMCAAHETQMALCGSIGISSSDFYNIMIWKFL